MYNPQFQTTSAVGQPATGPVVGGIQMPDWLRNGTPPDQPAQSPLTNATSEAPPWWRQMMSSYPGM
jgi:hypothetical protein